MRSTAIELAWADGRFLFDLKVGPIRAIEEKCDAGIGEVVARLTTALGPMGSYRFYMDDYRETILQGLVGGGMALNDAGAMVVKWVDGNPGAHHAMTALQIVNAWWYGVEEALGSVGKSEASEGESEPSKTEGSPSAQSMEMAS